MAFVYLLPDARSATQLLLMLNRYNDKENKKFLVPFPVF